MGKSIKGYQNDDVDHNDEKFETTEFTDRCIWYYVSRDVCEGKSHQINSRFLYIRIGRQKKKNLNTPDNS